MMRSPIMTTELLDAAITEEAVERAGRIIVTDAMAGQETLLLSRAILLYENGVRAMATVHEVKPHADEITGQKTPQICPGHCLTQGALDELLHSMGGMASRRTLLPEGILSYDGGRMIWWLPAQRRPIFFKTSKPEFNAAVAGKSVLHPPLLFVAEPGDLYIYALAQGVRPGPQTKVFRAPYFNIWNGGHMCAGNVAIPQTLRPEEIPVWEKTFFETNFTHNNYSDGPLLKKPHTHNDFWRMLAAPPEGVPETNLTVDWAKYLHPLDMTVDQAINRGEQE